MDISMTIFFLVNVDFIRDIVLNTVFNESIDKGNTFVWNTIIFFSFIIYKTLYEIKYFLCVYKTFLCKNNTLCNVANCVDFCAFYMKHFLDHLLKAHAS